MAFKGEEMALRDLTDIADRMTMTRILTRIEQEAM